nr:hypothetical protein [Candidatus Omnitrophota bacterium]
MKQSQKKYKRIVIKIGSSLFYHGGRLEELRCLEGLSTLAEGIKVENREIGIVASGAIDVGMDLKKLNDRPKKKTV